MHGLPTLAQAHVVAAHVFNPFVKMLARWVSSNTTSSAMKGLPRKWAIPGVDHIVAVASGKGGVGKSTTAGL